MAQGECGTPECNRLGSGKSPVNMRCCPLCGEGAPERHVKMCDIIEAVGNAELGEQDNIVLGYN